jgi:hypothetical protein
MTTTFRADVRAGMVAAVQAFITANPTLLRKVHTSRPTNFAGDIPFAYIDLLAETATHTEGTRERVMAPSVVIVSRPLDNETQVAAWDVLVDLLADHFTSYPQFTANSIWDRWTLTEEGEEVQTAPDSIRVFPTVRFTFDNVSLREGRS